VDDVSVALPKDLEFIVESLTNGTVQFAFVSLGLG